MQCQTAEERTSEPCREGRTLAFEMTADQLFVEARVAKKLIGCWSTMINKRMASDANDP